MLENFYQPCLKCNRTLAVETVLLDKRIITGNTLLGPPGHSGHRQTRQQSLCPLNVTDTHLTVHIPPEPVYNAVKLQHSEIKNCH